MTTDDERPPNLFEGVNDEGYWAQQARGGCRSAGSRRRSTGG